MKKQKIILIIFFLLFCLSSLNSLENEFYVKNKIISNCTNIKSPGNYILNNDISFNNKSCFNIYTNNVLIKCNNHTIKGNKENSFITLKNKSFNNINITFENCIVSNCSDEKEFTPLKIKYLFKNKTKLSNINKNFNLSFNITCFNNCNSPKISIISEDFLVNSYNLPLEKNKTETFNIKAKLNQKIESGINVSVYGELINNKEIKITQKTDELLLKTVDYPIKDNINNNSNNNTVSEINPHEKFKYLTNNILLFLLIIIIAFITLIIIFFSFKKIRKKFNKNKNL
ncbi:MAG: hypothetical protein ACOC3Z_00080 [Nanoarchaeota archaeon]